MYGWGLRRDQRRLRARRTALPAFVISVGNLTVGGTGKTPLSLWLARYLKQKGLSAAILSRGYGRKSSQVARAPAEGSTALLARHFGDEPVLMARSAGAPVWVGRNRTASGAEAIRTSSPQVLILDDGFQHLSLHRNLDLVLLDARDPFGNGELLPLGPLREPIEHLERCHGLVLTRADDSDRVRETVHLLGNWFPHKPVFQCCHKPLGFREGLDGVLISMEAMRDATAVAFAGLARPALFFDSLRQTGVRLVETVSFPDHHGYTPAETDRLLELQRQKGATCLITTQKDMVRLPEEIQPLLFSMEMDLDFGGDAAPFAHFLDEALASAPVAPGSNRYRSSMG